MSIMAMLLKAPAGAAHSSVTVDVNTSTHSRAFIEGWTDGAFPANVQPAPLWQVQGTPSPVYVQVTVPAGGTFAVTADGGTNSNIGSVTLYLTPTTTTSAPGGSTGGAVSFTSGSPGGKYGAALGSVVIPSAGTYYLWFVGTANTYMTLKYLHLDS